MATTSSPVPSRVPAPVPSPAPCSAEAAEDARRQQIIDRLSDKVVFYISQQVGLGYLVLGRRWQHTGESLDRPFGEDLTEVGRTSVFVKRQIDRIEAIRDALVIAVTPAPETSAQVSSGTSSLTISLDPYLAPLFKKKMSIQRMTIPRLPKQNVAQVEEELEEGEIREESAPKSAFRKLGGHLTNVRTTTASTSSTPAPAPRPTVHARTAAVPSASVLSRPRGKVVMPPKSIKSASTISSTSKKTAIKENRPIRPIPSKKKFTHPPKPSPPPKMAPNPSPPPKLAGVMTSEEISLATSRVVTMCDILYCLSPKYVFPEGVPLTGMPRSKKGRDEYFPHVRPVIKSLLEALGDEDKLQAELEIFRKLPEIINLENIPYLPERYVEEFKKTEVYTTPRDEVSKLTEGKKMMLIFHSLIHLNSVRIGERESVLAPITFEPPKNNERSGHCLILGS